jgi:hypothetical protein
MAIIIWEQGAMLRMLLIARTSTYQSFEVLLPSFAWYHKTGNSNIFESSFDHSQCLANNRSTQRKFNGGPSFPLTFDFVGRKHNWQGTIKARISLGCESIPSSKPTQQTHYSFTLYLPLDAEPTSLQGAISVMVSKAGSGKMTTRVFAIHILSIKFKCPPAETAAEQLKPQTTT